MVDPRLEQVKFIAIREVYPLEEAAQVKLKSQWIKGRSLLIFIYIYI